MFEKLINLFRKKPECRAVSYPAAPKRIILYMENIDDPVIGDAFIEAFMNAVAKTEYTDGMRSGEIFCRWQLMNTKITKSVALELTGQQVENK